MRLAKSIMLKNLRLCLKMKTLFSIVLLSVTVSSFAQSNSPYSRYGLGDMFPSSNITTRGMGSISAGYADGLSVNFENPASYSQFLVRQEERSKHVQSGRVVLDVGINLSSRTLIQPNTTNRFNSSDLIFSYLQVGLPIRKNWGLVFGIRPLSKIGYDINQTGLLTDPITENPIDSSITEYKGSGGSYLPSIGTGFAVGNLSAGFNFGYLFGSKETSTKRSLQNIGDSVLYNSSDYRTSTSFGGIFFNAGLQYKINFNDYTYLRLGVSGNWEQKLNASQDILRQTYTLGSAGEELTIDTVYSQRDVSGKLVYPSSYKAGFVVQHTRKDNSGWLFGADYTQSKWSNYLLMGQPDSVQDNWQINVGAQLFPKPTTTSYFSRVAYRVGFFTGPDYIKVRNNLPTFGGSFGMALPIGNYSRLSATQFSVVNITFEYGKRGNNNNLLKENLFRLSVGLNFTDLWFGKRKYD